MNCTEKELFDYMDSRRAVRVTCTDGQIFTGKCWAYGTVVSGEEFGIYEPTLDIGCGTVLAASKIEKIEFAD